MQPGPRTEPAAPAAPAALTVAFWLVAAETVVEVAFVATRDDYGPGGKVLVSLGFLAKVLLAHRARRFSAVGVLGLLTFELVGILVAIGADWAIGLRLALAANVICVTVLVLSSLRAFPTPELPRP